MKKLIKNYILEDINKLALKRNNKLFCNMQKEEFDLLLTQIAVRQKSMQKFPTLASNYDFVFASKIATEQASSEFTAHYKSLILNENNATLDLTGGLGVDSIYFAKQSKMHYYCEPAINLWQHFTKNCLQLNLKNISCYNVSAEEFILTAKQKLQHFDLIYVDPSRRNNNTKSFLIKESVPDICALQTDFATIASNAIIKLSPMFDIKQALGAIKSVSEVHIVSVDNECKELLLVCNYLHSIKNIRFVATNIITSFKGILNCEADITACIKTTQKLEVIVPLDNATGQLAYFTKAELSAISKYIYEPNSSIMKLGCWAHLCKQYDLKKVHLLSHLFTKSDFADTGQPFPGTIYEVIAVVSYSKKQVQAVMQGRKANVKCRNFPYSVENVKKKLQLVDGGDYYLFATTDLNNKLVIIVCRKQVSAWITA